MKESKRRKMMRRMGSTLVEMLVASTILSGSVLALSSISIRSMSETGMNRHYETAVGLLDKQLTVIDFVGVESFLNQGNTEGEFEGLVPKFAWRAGIQSLGMDNLYQVNITVSWLEGQQPHSVSIDTCLNGIGIIVEGETGTETETDNSDNSDNSDNTNG